MNQIFIITNPFCPRDGMERFEISNGWTIREWLAIHYGSEFTEFDQPTICQFNGKTLMRSQWHLTEFKGGDVCTFVVLPGDGVTIVLAVVAIVVSILAVLLIPDPKRPNSKEGETANNLRGQFNRMRLGEPVEVSYGRVRIWPSYAAPPYSRYAGNEQFQYSLYCIGQGSYQLEDFYLDDTLLSSFDDVSIQVVEPGESVTLFNSNVFQANEVSNLELYGINQDAFEGYLGGFIINASGTNVHRIEVDISLPQGLYGTDEESELENATVSYIFQIRKVDSEGVEFGPWETIIEETKTLATRNPRRFSISQDVTPNRYTIRGKRTNNKNEDISVSDMLVWEAVKGYAPYAKVYPNQTIVAIKIKASNSLNNNTRALLNLFVTRKLSKWDTLTETWGPLEATRNPIWAALDIFRANYGAKLESEYLDLTTFASLADQIDITQDWLDYTFDQKMGVWDAVKLALAVARIVPIPQGSIVTAVRDVPATYPAAIFNQHNIVEGSLTKQLAMFKFQDFDSVEVGYVDPNTWKPETVVASLPGRTRDNPEKIDLPGCTSRNRAYRFGMYFRARRELQRKTVKFRTGLEGHIPTYLDLVSVNHPILRMGSGGFVVAYDTVTNTLTLSDSVSLDPAKPNSIIFRGDDGAIVGVPIAISPGPTPNKVILASDPLTIFDFSENQLPPFYALGVSNNWAFLGKVVSIEPSGNSEVEITLLNYAPQVYGFDGYTMPELPAPVFIATPLIPILATVSLSHLNVLWDGLGKAFWTPSISASFYKVEKSNDGIEWEELTTTSASYVFLTIRAGNNYVRVSGVSSGGQGPWIVSNNLIGISVLPNSVLNEDMTPEFDEDDNPALDES